MEKGSMVLVKNSKSPSNVWVESFQKLDKGGVEGDKFLASLSIANHCRRRHAGNYILKEYRSGELEMLTDIIKLYSRMRQNKLPVPSTACLAIQDQTNYFLLMTDMRKNGKLWGISGCPSDDSEKEFDELQIGNKDMPFISNETRRLKTIANNMGMILYHNTYHLVRNETGELSVCLLDINPFKRDKRTTKERNNNERLFFLDQLRNLI